MAIEALNLQPTCNQLVTNTISRQSALDSIGHDPDDTYDRIKSLPSAEPKTARIIYNFLKKKIGSEIIDNPFEFEDWYNRMIWHVQECYRLRKKYEDGEMAEPRTWEWIIHDEVKNIYGGIYIECSECGTKFVTQTLEDELFCRNCGARMIGEEK